jgi:hypothetical protein
MKAQGEMMEPVPADVRTRMLAIRITRAEQHRVRLHALTARVPICELVRGALGTILTEDPAWVTGKGLPQ